MYGCYTKHLRASSLENWNMCSMQSNLKNNMVSGQSRNNRFTGVEHQLRLVTLASIVGSLLWARSSWTFDLGFRTGVLRTAWWNCWGLRPEWLIPYHRRCATRLRSQSTVIFCCFGICHAKMEACRWSGWHRSYGWGSKFDIRFADDILNFCSLVWNSHLPSFVNCCRV